MELISRSNQNNQNGTFQYRCLNESKHAVRNSWFQGYLYRTNNNNISCTMIRDQKFKIVYKACALRGFYSLDLYCRKIFYHLADLNISWFVAASSLFFFRCVATFACRSKYALERGDANVVGAETASGVRYTCLRVSVR